MESPSNLLSLFRDAAHSAGLEFYVIGGYAVSYWAAPRFTADVDVVICEEDYNLGKSVASSIGYREVFLHPKGAFAHFASKDSGGFRLDFMIVDPSTWQKLRSGGQTATLGEELRFPVIDPKHLIAMKLHAARQPDRKERFKDLNDVSEIMLSQGISFVDLESDGIIQDYGTEQTIQRVQEILRGKESEG